MAKEWYEPDDNESVWWKATKKNKQRICPDWFENTTQFGFGAGALFSQAGKSLGVKMPMSIILGAGTRAEMGLTSTLAGISWCGGAYIGAALDAAYQINHNGEHLGTGITDWYVAKEKGVEDFLISIHEWWKS